MEHPEYLYYVALGLFGALAMPFNRLASVVVMAWVFGQLAAVLFGDAPAHRVDLTADVMGLAFGLCIAWMSAQPAAWFTASLFLPMAILHCMATKGLIHPYYQYWLNFYLALVQLASLPASNDWRRIHRTLTAYRAAKPADWFFRVMARRHAL